MASILHNSFDDERQFREISYKWSVAWDTKDLALFQSITAPEIVADYTQFFVGGRLHRCDADTLWKGFFSELNLGHPDLKTQHLLGASMFSRVSENEAKGSWQARAYHVRTFKDGKNSAWDTTAFVEHTYVKVNGEWKLGGWRPHTILAEAGKVGDVMGKL